MSDGYSDMIEYCHNVFADCLRFMIRHHTGQNQLTQAGYQEFQNKIHSMPAIFWKDILKLPDCLAIRFSPHLDWPALLPLEELFLLLVVTGRPLEVIKLQKATKYKDRLLLFFDEQGSLLPNGIHYQNRFWDFVDGDQDILLGYAKKRHHRQPFNGKPVMLVAARHHYRKRFILKDVVVF